jgi:hypothetical protein
LRETKKRRQQQACAQTKFPKPQNLFNIHAQLVSTE